jgi:hypothetical protein
MLKKNMRGNTGMGCRGIWRGFGRIMLCRRGIELKAIEAERSKLKGIPPAIKTI